MRELSLGWGGAVLKVEIEDRTAPMAAIITICGRIVASLQTTADHMLDTRASASAWMDWTLFGFGLGLSHKRAGIKFHVVLVCLPAVNRSFVLHALRRFRERAR